LPGGNTDKGLGANKNEIFLSLENSTQYIDWWHEPVPEEDFDHEGSLLSFVLRPGAIYGISNKINLYLTTTIGVRSMDWFGDNYSLHHRDEHTGDDFDNAIGGVLGDSKIILRYLLKNTGAGDGYRIIIGSGITIPSTNTLTIDPFVKSDGIIAPHRHFSMSDGTYNYNSDLQIFYKRSANPVFFGGSLSIEKPIDKNEYSYLSPTSTKGVISAIYKRFDKLDGSIDISLGIQSFSLAYWGNKPSPNSDAFTMTPSLSYLFNLKKGALSIGLQKPFFLSGSFAGNEGDIKQTTKVWQLIVAYRSMSI
tara:strand:+ start:356 stop:1276 length:921 start_codon:yes stop_codon:yes gene_type:complete